MDQLRSPGVRPGRWNGQNIRLLQISIVNSRNTISCGVRIIIVRMLRGFLTAVKQTNKKKKKPKK